MKRARGCGLTTWIGLFSSCPLIAGAMETEGCRALQSIVKILSVCKASAGELETRRFPTKTFDSIEKED
jgi:hypothetical protein